MSWNPCKAYKKTCSFNVPPIVCHLYHSGIIRLGITVPDSKSAEQVASHKITPSPPHFKISVARKTECTSAAVELQCLSVLFVESTINEYDNFNNK